ncbi:MAG: hypothetical protein MUF83_00580 [Acidimicrobiales bacterium]|jgi:hypothetical protein|nr:hypothetical protein [Acidimicrobiales bacterium]
MSNTPPPPGAPDWGQPAPYGGPPQPEWQAQQPAPEWQAQQPPPAWEPTQQTPGLFAPSESASPYQPEPAAPTGKSGKGGKGVLFALLGLLAVIVVGVAAFFLGASSKQGSVDDAESALTAAERETDAEAERADAAEAELAAAQEDLDSANAEISDLESRLSSSESDLSSCASAVEQYYYLSDAYTALDTYSNRILDEVAAGQDIFASPLYDELLALAGEVDAANALIDEGSVEACAAVTGG